MRARTVNSLHSWARAHYYNDGPVGTLGRSFSFSGRSVHGRAFAKSYSWAVHPLKAKLRNGVNFGPADASPKRILWDVCSDVAQARERHHDPQTVSVFGRRGGSHLHRLWHGPSCSSKLIDRQSEAARPRTEQC
jgi:hypothetical protein